MGFKCGIVGLPNVGKSTIFNAITNTANAQVANYPFCTIEPNIGRVAVPDERLSKLAKIENSARIVPVYTDIVDIAGLVRGASSGEGLGNQFLGHIKEVDAILHIVRAFEDKNITHVENNVDPIRDIEIIETELLLADIATIKKRLVTIEKKVKIGDKTALIEKNSLTKVLEALNSGKGVRFVNLLEGEHQIIRQLQLLTNKPVLYVANVEEVSSAKNNFLNLIELYAKNNGSKVVKICAKLESEMINFAENDKKIFLSESGFGETGLGQIVKNGYDLLDLITFFTVGETETRAWSVKKNSIAPVVASVIHTDFEKNFIKAEVISYHNFIEYSGSSGAKEAGKLRLEGKGYIVQDGDVIHFRVSV